MKKLCLHREGSVTIVQDQFAPREFRLPVPATRSLSMVTENGEFPPPYIEQWQEVYRRTGIVHGDMYCYTFVCSELTQSARDRKKGCERDTDNDGNCDIHPFGCLP